MQSVVGCRAGYRTHDRCFPINAMVIIFRQRTICRLSVPSRLTCLWRCGHLVAGGGGGRGRCFKTVRARSYWFVSLHSPRQPYSHGSIPNRGTTANMPSSCSKGFGACSTHHLHAASPFLPVQNRKEIAAHKETATGPWLATNVAGASSL
jgi:hypothetical protein